MQQATQTVLPPPQAAATPRPGTAPAFFGWRVTGATFVLAVFGWGVGFYGPPIYLYTVSQRPGLGFTLASTAVTLHFLFGAIVVANLPGLYGRFGVPVVTKSAVIALALGVGGWSLAQAPWQLFLAAVLSGAGWVAMSAAAVNAIIAPWFVRKRPAALATAYNGASIGGVLFSPLWVFAIGLLGFPTASLVVGLAMVIAIWLLADRVFARTPESMGQSPDGDAAAVPVAALATPPVPPLAGASLWRNRHFLTLAAGMALSLFAQIGMIAHLYSLLVPALGGDVAGLAMGGATAAAILGRTIVGWTMPQGVDRRLVACASYVVQITGALLLLLAGGQQTTLLLAGVALFGAGIGNTTSLPPMIAQTEFAKEDVQRVVSLIVAMSQAAFAFAPAILGLLRAPTAAETGAAPAFFLAVAAIQAAAIAAMLLGRRGR